ncbi:hypothetical protein ACFRCG_41905 [Embleya sp. NPDC056575]|uniref:hypothetical protein n=1 Tax=unclassified Embleya TaxID=2699296 RepID=UPI0036811A74
MTYQVVFADLLTDETIARFAADGLRFGRRIGEAEEISGSIPIRDAPTAERLRALVAKRTAVYVYQGQTILCGGVLWTPTPKWSKRSAETWEFSASTFESYWDRVVISDDIPELLGVDQFVIARSLVDHMQADPHANIGVLTHLNPAMAEPLSGVTRDRTEYLASANKSYGEALAELGKVLDGFEWTIDVWADPVSGIRTKHLRLGHPTIGRPDGALVLERQDLEAWETPPDPTAGTRFRARGGTPQGSGAGQQQPLLSDIHSRDDLLSAGWPRLDVVEDHSTVEDVDVLNDYAAKAVATLGGPVAIPQLGINLGRAAISPLNLGDTVRLRMRTVYAGLVDVRYRMVGITVQAGGRTSPGTAQLTLEEVAT